MADDDRDVPLAARRLKRQLSGLTSWNRHAEQERNRPPAATGREAAMDRRRRMEALGSTQDALDLRTTGRADEDTTGLTEHRPRALLVHRSAWLLDGLTHCLEEVGVHVVARSGDGGEAVGIAIAEQPEVVVLEDKLPTKPAAQVVAELRQFAPGTLVAVHVEHDEDLEKMAGAGAAAVFGRRVAPARMAQTVLDLLVDGGGPILLR